MFGKLLIANRGEIAVRIIRACRELGVSSVAVYSDPDRLAPHVLMADEAVPIGPAPSIRSYLDMDSLLEAAHRTGAEAVHPGYGFHAENPEFARRVAEAGLVFVGPPPEAAEAMGDKTAARQRMREAGVPIIPGSDGPVGDLEAARTAAREIGYPVMLKAVAGGGGKGMRIVREAGELPGSLRAARSEARQAFGDDRVYVERWLADPRHIEIQLLADGRGTTVHLGERECSIQRRHQKLIEEAPSPVIDAPMRRHMGEVAVAAARAVDYRGAGTVEFLYEDGEFYFLEMNTRIQVEHPVTEMVTGVDLVREQIRLAAGEPLGWLPDPAWPIGHAIECRISGEDPFKGFLPSAGRIEHLHTPSGPGVRWESGVTEGFEVGLHYDPLLAKLIVHAPTRERAIDRMKRALRELGILGLATTQPFHINVMEEEDFRAGRLSVRYVEEHPELVRPDPADRRARAAAAAAVLLEEELRATPHPRPAEPGRGSVPHRGPTQWQRAYAPE
ncbi:MAG: acetyl-CoA carboxylase biotin carboxylase subunit [Gemmatimonadota bacterium]